MLKFNAESTVIYSNEKVHYLELKRSISTGLFSPAKLVNGEGFLDSLVMCSNLTNKNNLKVNIIDNLIFSWVL